MSEQNGVSRMRDVQKISLNLPCASFDELHRMSVDSGRSMTDILRAGLGLYRMAAAGKLMFVELDGSLTRIMLF